MSDATKIIFLDFDGPLTNARVQLAGGDHYGFDPVAVKALHYICEHTGAKIVCTSTRCADREDVRDETFERFRSAGLDPKHIHEDWTCYYSFNLTRSECIARWWSEHPEIETYAIIDDEDVALPYFVKVDDINGIMLQDFVKVANLLAFDLADVFRLSAQSHFGAQQNENDGINFLTPKPQ